MIKTCEGCGLGDPGTETLDPRGGMIDRPIITIVLRPTREGDLTLALRSLLKRALRCYGLRAVKIEIEPACAAAGDRDSGRS